MSDPASIDRFQELEAGRILGDLDRDEEREWMRLAKTRDAGVDASLELTAAALETTFLEHNAEPLPAELALLLRRDATRLSRPEARSSEDAVVALPASVWKRLISSPEVAWAIAALLMALLVANFLAKRPVSPPAPLVVSSPTQISPQYAKAEFLKFTSNFTKADFAGVGSYTGMKGEVIWSDEMQEGYLTLTNLPVNDPAREQYQLWIVDPARDKNPVDGGVFDIPRGNRTAIVPIRNSLVVRDCEAFVITLERPGGVVVSKQEIVVAQAKPS